MVGDRELGQHFEPDIDTRRTVVASLENPLQICTAATSCLDSFFLLYELLLLSGLASRVVFTHKSVS